MLHACASHGHHPSPSRTRPRRRRARRIRGASSSCPTVGPSSLPERIADADRQRDDDDGRKRAAREEPARRVRDHPPERAWRPRRSRSSPTNAAPRRPADSRTGAKSTPAPPEVPVMAPMTNPAGPSALRGTSNASQPERPRDRERGDPDEQHVQHPLGQLAREQAADERSRHRAEDHAPATPRSMSRRKRTARWRLPRRSAGAVIASAALRPTSTEQSSRRKSPPPCPASVVSTPARARGVPARGS